jgi:hypothetical protein
MASITGFILLTARLILIDIFELTSELIHEILLGLEDWC